MGAVQVSNGRTGYSTVQKTYSDRRPGTKWPSAATAKMSSLAPK